MYMQNFNLLNQLKKGNRYAIGLFHGEKGEKFRYLSTTLIWRTNVLVYFTIFDSVPSYSKTKNFSNFIPLAHPLPKIWA